MKLLNSPLKNNPDVIPTSDERRISRVLYRNTALIAIVAGLPLLIAGCGKSNTHVLDDALITSLNVGETLARATPGTGTGERRYSGELNTAALAMERGDYDSAVATLETLSLSETNNPLVFYNLAKADLELAQTIRTPQAKSSLLDKARIAVETAISQDPNWADAWALRARVAKTIGDKDNALDYIDKARDLDPLNPAMAFRAAEIYMEYNLKIEAKKALDFAVTEDPNNPRYLLTMGYFYSTLPSPNHQEAMRYYNLASTACRRMNPVPTQLLSDALNNLGGTLKLLGHPADALKVFNQAIDVQPNNYLLYMNRARLLMDQRRYYKVYNRTAALRSALRAVALTNGRNARALAVLSRAYYEMNDFKSAVDRIRLAIDIAPLAFYRKLLSNYQIAERYDHKINEADSLIP